MALIDEGLRRTGRLPTAGTTTSPVDPYAAYYEAYGIDPDSSLGKMVLDLIADGELIDEAFDIIADRFNVGPYAPAPKAAPAGRTQFASERELDVAQTERLRQQSVLDAERIAQEKEIADAANEVALKRERLNVLQNLVGNFIGAQQSATETLAGLGPRPFRFAAAAAGMPVLGTTPQAGFEEALGGFISRPVPGVDPNAPIGAIEGAIGGLTGQRAPLAPGVLGLADGGVIEMTRGDDGSYSALPIGVEARLVGEGRHGEGIAAGTAEVMLKTPTMTAIIPLKRGLQAGGVQFDPQTVLQSLLPLYQRLGITNIPVNQPGGTHPFGTRGLDAATIQNLGYNPSFVQLRNPAAGEPFRYFIRSPDGGFREIGERFLGNAGMPPISSAFNLRSIDELAKLGTVGTALKNTEIPDFMNQFLNPQNLTDRPQLSAPLIDPVTGALLPAPYRIAPQITRGLADPTRRLGLGTALGAFDSPTGIPIDLDALRRRTATGPAFRPIGFR